jgi:LPXTG-site transpeptidase (sortase) family protein
VTKFVDPAAAQVGDSVVFTIEVFNNGNADAENVIITDVIPVFLDIISVVVVPSGPAPMVTGKTVTINLGTVSADDMYTITIRTTVNRFASPPGGSNTVSLISDSDDANMDNNSDSATIAIARVPDTGFGPGQNSQLPQQHESLSYDQYGEVWIAIPTIDVRAAIVGVPLTTEGWDVTWLWDQVGYLEGTAFPGWAGNSVLTSHVYLSSGLPGPFARLRELRWGDRVIVKAFGTGYVYEVRESKLHRPDDSGMIPHEERPWLTLITCQGFDADRGLYRWRRVVRAVLVDVFALP